MSGPVALNVKFVLKPETSKSAFLTALKLDQEQTLAKEPGALQFVIGQDDCDDNAIHLHEQYKTEEDLEYHRSTPHFIEFIKYTMDNDVFGEDPVIDTFACQHDNDDDTPTKISPRKAYCLNVESCIKPEFRQDFLKLMASHQANSRAEPLCFQFDWGESPETPNCFYMHEEYHGVEGYKAHETSLHFDKFMVFNKREPYSKPQVVSFYKTFM